jgi:hypothetical protein
LDWTGMAGVLDLGRHLFEQGLDQREFVHS